MAVENEYNEVVGAREDSSAAVDSGDGVSRDDTGVDEDDLDTAKDLSIGKWGHISRCQNSRLVKSIYKISDY